MYPSQANCCKTCDGCSINGRNYKTGDIVSMPESSCETCMCQSGELSCRRKQCPDVQCNNPVLGQCCPECPGLHCSYNDKVYKDGETFHGAGENCSTCVCSQGTVICDKHVCPSVICTHPAISDCCPLCRHCSYQGQILKHGEMVGEGNDSCKRCRCEAGSIKCYPPRCPEVSCPHPVKQGCCDKCESCMLNGLLIQNGDAVTNPSDPCQRCLCRNGKVSCREEVCPPVTCWNPVKGDCCLTCPAEKNCNYQGKQYSDGELFREERDICTECVCQEGVVSCNNNCRDRLCLHPYQGQCEQCYYSNRRYSNGQIFEENCSNCVCSGRLMHYDFVLPFTSLLNNKI